MAQKHYGHYDDYDRPPTERKETLATRFRDLCEDLDRSKRRMEKRRMEKRAEADLRRRTDARLAEEAARSAETEAERRRRIEKQIRLESETEAETVETNYGKSDLTAANHVATEDVFREEKGKKYRTVEVTRRFPIYLAVLVFAFVFTQALHAKASNIFMGFVFFLPILLLLYALSARLALQVSILSENATVSKGEPYVYEMKLTNRGILAYPFIEAEMLLPEANSVRTGKRTVALTMNPLGAYHVKNTVRFRFRGTYHIGVNYFYVYDFFRIFRVRVDVKSAATVLVLPRRLMLPDRPNVAVSDEIDPSVRRSDAAEKVEACDVRDYRPGDPLKSIHWNLSSRTEDLIVKDYVGGGTKLTYIYCDLAARFPSVAPDAAEHSNADLKREKRERKAAERREERRQRFILKARERETDLSEEELSRQFDAYEGRGERKREEKLRRRHTRLLVRYARAQVSSPRYAKRLYGKIAAIEQSLAAGNEENTANAYGVREEDAMLLRSAELYEDMNEYCADGVIELTLAATLRELRSGNEVVLAWYDDRSATGICAYSFRSPEELQTVHSLFATAPLVSGDRFVGGLSALAGDVTGVKQIFVTSSVDGDAIERFSDLKTVSAAVSGNEILLYDPTERFRYPEKRNVYIEGCREALLKNGFRLTSETPLDTLGKEGAR